MTPKEWWTTTKDIKASQDDGYPPRLYRDVNGKTFHYACLPVKVVIMEAEEFVKAIAAAEERGVREGFQAGMDAIDRHGDQSDTVDDYLARRRR